MLERIERDATAAVKELLAVSHLKAGDVLVIGCSSSEMVGDTIGTNSSMDAAAALAEAVLPLLKEAGVYLAVQCCEHLNRALIIEAAAAEKYGYDPVNVVPQPKAGGSFATTVWGQMEHPVRWSTSVPTQAWISAAPSSVCICGMWRFPCAWALRPSAPPPFCAPAPAPSLSVASAPYTTIVNYNFS